MPTLPSIPSYRGVRIRGGAGPDEPRPPAPVGRDGGIQGMDVQRRPNFSIIQQGIGTYIFSANEVNAGVKTQIASFLKRVRGKILVNNEPVSKRTARRIIPQLLRKGSVEIKIV